MPGQNEDEGKDFVAPKTGGEAVPPKPEVQADNNQDTRVPPDGAERSNGGSPLLRDENGRAYTVKWVSDENGNPKPETTMHPQYDEQRAEKSSEARVKFSPEERRTIAGALNALNSEVANQANSGTINEQNAKESNYTSFLSVRSKILENSGITSSEEEEYASKAIAVKLQEINQLRAAETDPGIRKQLFEDIARLQQLQDKINTGVETQAPIVETVGQPAQEQEQANVERESSHFDFFDNLPQDVKDNLVGDYTSSSISENPSPSFQIQGLLESIDSNLKSQDPNIRASAGRLLSHFKQDQAHYLSPMTDYYKKAWGDYIDQVWQAEGKTANEEWKALRAGQENESSTGVETNPSNPIPAAVESAPPLAEQPPTLESLSFGKGILLSDPRITVTLLNQAKERVLSNRAIYERTLIEDRQDVSDISVRRAIEVADRDLKTIEYWIQKKEQRL